MSEAQGEGEVTLAHYALVTAGLADGIALEALLEHVEVSANRWAEAELVWTQRMVAELAAGCRLALELDAMQQEAREIWRRPIPPLDEDLKAWLDFQRGLAEHDDPPAYLESIPLRVGDLGMLQRLWSGRMAKEPQLVAQAASILTQPAELVRVPPPPPTRLPARVHDVDSTGFLSALIDREALGLPFAGKTDEVKVAPALSVPLPKPPAQDGLDGTAWLSALVADGGLPFVTSNKEHSEPTPAPRGAKAVALDKVLFVDAPASAAVATPSPPSPVAAAVSCSSSCSSSCSCSWEHGRRNGIRRGSDLGRSTAL